jgi:hypothetical protein
VYRDKKVVSDLCAFWYFTHGDDNFSKGIYKDYIEALDPSKVFLQSDIDEFAF